MTTLKSQAEAREIAAREEELRKRAARQAQKVQSGDLAVETVECVVLPLGANKISMGEHIGGLGEVHYEEEEKVSLPLPLAQVYRDRGWVNFKAKAPKAESATAQ